MGTGYVKVSFGFMEHMLHLPESVKLEAGYVIVPISHPKIPDGREVLVNYTKDQVFGCDQLKVEVRLAEGREVVAEHTVSTFPTRAT